MKANAQANLLSLDQRIQRKRRREIERRYRKKQNCYVIKLGMDIQQLRDNIEQLEQRKHGIVFSIPTKDMIWNVVVEYFRVFRYGLPSVAQTTMETLQPSAQLDFVRSSLMESVMFNSEHGVDALLQCCKVTLEGMKKSGAGSVDAVTETSVTIMTRTLRNLFPHLCHDEDGVMSPLVLELLDQRITMRGITRFKWDPAFGRVTSVTAESDMLTPMLQLLGNLRNVSRAFENALISPAFQLKLERARS